MGAGGAGLEGAASRGMYLRRIPAQEAVIEIQGWHSGGGGGTNHGGVWGVSQSLCAGGCCLVFKLLHSLESDLVPDLPIPRPE